MTPLYKDTPEEVAAHNATVTVQREAFAEGIRESVFMTPEAVKERAEKRYPFAELRPSGFVGGSGTRYDYGTTGLAAVLPGGTLDGKPHIRPSDRAAASAALTHGVEVWHLAIWRVASRLNCPGVVAVQDHEPEIIAEAQAILDREGNK